MALKLIIGNKNYSSWSFRPWLAMKVANMPFDEEVIPLDASDFKTRLCAFPGSGKVPLLVNGAVHVWESIAILEYLAEQSPGAKLWPQDGAARARARAVAAEMHAGFTPLRQHLPMNMRRPVRRRELTPEALANIRRIEAMWSDCRSQFGRGGNFLFGDFGAADAMYAPIVSRFRTYDVEVSAICRAYMEAVMALPAWGEWEAAARAETGVLPEDEVDWPVVLRA
jgi:glutathione S-transferase